MDKAHTASWFGAAGAIFGAWSLTEWMAVAGVIVALIGTFIKWREYKLKRDWMEFKKKNLDKLKVSIDDEAAK